MGESNVLESLTREARSVEKFPNVEMKRSARPAADKVALSCTRSTVVFRIISSILVVVGRFKKSE